MIQEALNSGTGATSAAGAKKKKGISLKKKKKVEVVDLATRVLNDYGENPHL